MKRNISLLCALGVSAAMMAQTYQVTVTTTDGETKTFDTDKLKSIQFTPAPPYIDCDTFLTGLYDEVSDTRAAYNMSFGNCEADASGEPADVMGLHATLTLWGPHSEDALNPIVPSGFYRANIDGSLWSFDLQKSAIYIRVQEGDGGVTSGFCIDGTVDVERTGENYDIRCELVLIDGSNIDLHYVGPMMLTPGSSTAGDFKEDQLDITFEGAQGRFWANWFYPFADDGSVQLYNGTFDENGSQVEGYWLNLDLYMPKDPAHLAPNWKPVIPDGVYTFEKREKVYENTYMPFTMLPGQVVDLWGIPALTNTYISHISADGTTLKALLCDGTVTVSENGTKFDIDMKDENGIRFTGSCSARPNIMNCVDNENEPKLTDFLTSDFDLEFIPGTAAIDYNMGDYIVPGLYSHILMITEPNMEKGDYISVQVFSDTKDELPDGVYAINDELQNFTGLKGRFDFGGSMLYSWFGDLDSTDDEGYQTVLAPIEGGTVTIKTEGGVKTITLSLNDADGFKIAGEWKSDSKNQYVYTDGTAMTESRRAMPRAFRKGIAPKWKVAHKDAPARQLIR